MDIELTADEKLALSALKRLAKRWPKTLWIYSGDGGAMVLKTGSDGKKAKLGDTIDPNYIVGHVPGAMHIDGGVW